MVHKKTRREVERDEDRDALVKEKGASGCYNFKYFGTKFKYYKVNYFRMMT